MVFSKRLTGLNLFLTGLVDMAGRLVELTQKEHLVDIEQGNLLFVSKIIFFMMEVLSILGAIYLLTMPGNLMNDTFDVLCVH